MTWPAPHAVARRDAALLARIHELEEENRQLRRRILARAHHAPAPIVARLVQAAAEEFGVAAPEIYGPRRTAEIALARQVVMHLAVARHGRSLPQTGRSLGRDHTTILHGVRAMAARIAEDPALAARVERVAAAATHPPTTETTP